MSCAFFILHQILYFLCVVDSCLRTNNAAASWQWPCVSCLKCRYFCSFYLVWVAPEESIGIPMTCALTSEFAVPLPPSPGEVVQDIPAQPGLARNFLDLDIAKLININSRLNKSWSDWLVSTYFQISHLEDLFALGGSQFRDTSQVRDYSEAILLYTPHISVPLITGQLPSDLPLPEAGQWHWFCSHS